MSEPQRAYGYSAKVSLNLEVDGRLISLHQIGPDSIWLREPIDLPPGDATVIMHVDEFEQQWAVYLPDGLSANSREARTIDRRPAATASVG
jgi:hypothetical protein